MVEKFLTSSSINFSYNRLNSSLLRARSFTPESVAQVFKSTNPLCTPFNIILENYNCDETVITIVQHKHKKILGLKGKRQISSVQTTERGFLVTVVTCLSPTGHFIPPLLVFPRKNMKQELMNGTSPGSIHACLPSGWTQSEIFIQWFLHFIKPTKPTK